LSGVTSATDPNQIPPGDLWPLVARDEELSAVGAALAGVGPRSLLLRGAIGCGATRLLSHAADEAEAKGQRVLRLQAMPSTRLVDFGVLGAFVPELLEGAPGSRAALTATAILALRASAWTAVAVDDVPSLDDATAAVIHHLVMGGTLSLVATAHDGEALPEPISALRVADLLEVLTLAPLDDDGVASLVEGAVGGRLDGGSTRRLAVASSGNPLMVVELVRAAVQDGTLHHDHGTWRWDQHATNLERLADMVDRQLVGLSEGSREVCALVAMAESLTLAEILALDITAAAAEAEQAGLLVVERPSTVRMAHPVHATAVADRIEVPGDLARRLIELRMTEDDADPRRLLAVIRMLRVAGVLYSAEQLVEGAWIALRLGNYDDAQDFARQAVVMERSVESLRPLAEALLRAPFGAAEQASLVYREMIGLAATDDDRSDAAIGLHRAAVLEAQRRGRGGGGIDGDTSDADGVGAARERLRALASRLRDGRARSSVRIELVRSLAMVGDLRGAVELGESIVLDPGADPRHRLHALEAVSGPEIMLGRAHRLDELCALTSRAAETGLRDRAAIAAHAAVRAGAAIGAGDLERAAELADHVAQLRDEDRLDPVVQGLKGAIALEQGDARAALRALQDRAARFGDPDDPWASGLDLVRLAEASARLGLVADAEQARDRLRALCTTTGIGVTAALVAMAELWVSLARHPDPGSDEAATADDAACACASTDHAWLALVARRLAWLIAPTPQRAAALRSAAALVEGGWAASVTAHIEGVEAGGGAELMDLARESAQRGRHLDAVVLADSANAALTAAGSTRAAILAAVFAEQQTALCGNPRMLHPRASVSSPQLSPREREIAEFAAEGWTNREIASRLHLSVRTVEGHVLKACTKLGVQDRTGLAELLAQW
jgi:DNA-binding CsgD family transcriptional regulator